MIRRDQDDCARSASSRRLSLLCAPKQAIKQPAGLWDEIDVADKLRAPMPVLENDLAAMKGFKLGTMTNADDGRSFRAPWTRAPSIYPGSVDQERRSPHRAR